MYRIRRFGVVKTATVVAVMYVLVTAIVGVPVAILVVLAGRGRGIEALGPTVAAGALFVVAFYGIFGWIFTAIACALYNVAAGWVGGIEVQVEPVTPPPAPPVWGPTTATTPPTAPPPGWGPTTATTPPTAPPPG